MFIMSPTSKMQESLHLFYRIFVTVYYCTFFTQHLIWLYQIQDNVSELVDTLYVLLTLLNSLGKLMIFNVRRTRIKHIVEIIKGPVFAPNSKRHEELIMRNAAQMKRLFRAYQGFGIVCSAMWMMYPLMTRFLGEEVRFPMYWPFSTDKLPTFLFVVAYNTIMVHWISISMVAMDCITVGFYMQAQLQLQMLRYNFMHLADTEDETNDEDDDKFEVKIYRDVESSQFENLFRKRLIMCIKRQQLIVWLVDEVESVFGSSMVLQFLVIGWIISMTVYKIIGLNVMSAEFVTMIAYLGCVLLQLFLFCYYGTQLKVESEFVNQSIYESDWTALSPRLRRPLLIMMERCYQPVAPCIAYVVPMSLDTFISIVKSAYSLYTFLDQS
ncbi:PREDICTED: odorant receptor 22b-like isoform X2 [Papilio polytes]|uniref:odorant receptor 22b-like isoform X2 n=1 Tax=Papilio polytes TaxID=76194 RepID=UPI0006764259|nr:PREDICTED: odorant receptor 22b-like isoform X2 [Papilio polytes]